MAAFSISAPSPSSAIISTPGQVTLNFDVSGNPDPIKLTYHLNSGNNLFFKLADGSEVKEITQNFNLQNSPKSFSDILTIVKSGNNPNFSLGFINIDGIDTANNDPDSQQFTVHFS
ncbi:hypothetical protein J3L18_25700 [Mucilaginibacter gossypii]|uniref:hypothetical protein n=1 Tax=Mucilaginibacter gossypii TaxID=551996 RepID=UPI000DCC75EA|nr:MULTISPECIES: hypothetical protein [Mucilaginibacter]QTE36493.1 hypothetical protein J3L18_25700 [Mucilaginibacter gossypii]RAV48653.1 hypothetical protein DIU36_28130 [Mucilaginibacter rubeus]